MADDTTNTDQGTGATQQGDTQGQQGTQQQQGAQGTQSQQQGDQGATQTKTTVGNDGGDQGTQQTAADWPADWREKYANGDDKKLTRLKRYASPAAALDAMLAAQNKIASGELKAPLPKDAKPEEIAQWRKDNGIPEKPEGYLDKLPQGLVIGDDDKERVGTFTKAMHDSNVPPDVVHKALGWYYQTIEAEQTARADKDNELAQAGQDALRAEWGGEYRANMNALNNLLETLPKGTRELWMNARLADGTPLMSHVDSLRWIVQTAKDLNPAATVVPGAGANTSQAVSDEIKAIEADMANKTSDYWTGPKNAQGETAKQVRYRELVEARNRLQARAA